MESHADTIAAIMRRGDAPLMEPPKANAPSAEIEILQLLFWRPQPDVQAIAAGLGISVRSARIHLQVLFKAGMLYRRITREKTLCYDLTPAGKGWVGYENVMAKDQVDYRAVARKRRLTQLIRLVEGKTP